MLRFHNALHGQKQLSLYDDDGFLVFARGETGMVAINKTGSWQYPAIFVDGVRHGSYRCQIHGYRMQLDGGSITLAIPPREAQMWLYSGE